MNIQPREGSRPTPLKLSKHKIDILSRVARGDTNKQIALDLGITYYSVHQHRQQIRQFLGVSCTQLMVHYALKMGYIKNQYDN